MSQLKSLGLFVTESCNLGCPYCFASNMERKVISRETAERAVDLLFAPEVKAEKVNLTFWGGEPLMEFPFIEELVRYAEKRAEEAGKTISFSIPTNTTLLSDRIVDFCRAHDVSLSLSLDGAEPTQSARITKGGKSSYPQVERALEIIDRRYAPRYPGVRMTVSPSTAPRFYENIRFFLDRGMTSVYFAPVHEMSWSPEELEIYEAQQRRLADEWCASFEAGVIPKMSFHSWNKLLAWRAYVSSGRVDKSAQQIACGAGTSMLAVDIYGEIYPCHRFAFYDKEERTVSLGHVDDGLPDAEAVEAFARLDASSVGTRELLCADCPDLATCRSFCPAVNYAMTKDLGTVAQIQCDLARLEQRVVAHIEARLSDCEAFERFRDGFLLEAYKPGAMSSELARWLGDLSVEERSRVVDRAAHILEQLAQKRGTK